VELVVVQAVLENLGVQVVLDLRVLVEVVEKPAVQVVLALVEQMGLQVLLGVQAPLVLVDLVELLEVQDLLVALDHLEQPVEKLILGKDYG
jgi:predicted TIM-barrel fold metal-dependent hydrolase